MASLPRRKEAAPISMNMISDCIDDEDAKHERNTDFSTYNFDRTKSVSLSFKGIAKIENLQVLRNLTHLRIDNNNISVIEGIDHMKSLQWLDLSFNNITEIGGLANLTLLTDLSLFGNQIERLTGLGSLPALQCLSVGNNKVSDIREVKALTSLPKLQFLTLEGNPIAKRREVYKNAVLLSLPHLKYLDYALVLPIDITIAQETATATPAEEDRPVRRGSAVQDEHSNSSIIPPDDSITRYMYDDPEIQRFSVVPSFSTTLHGISAALLEAEMDYTRLLQHLLETIESEVAAFNFAYLEVREPFEAEVRSKLGAWEAKYTKLARPVFIDMEAVNFVELAGAAKLLQEEAEITASQCVREETLKHKDLRNMLEAVEVALTDLRTKLLAAIEAFFRKAEDIHAQSWPQQVLHVEAYAENVKAGLIPKEDVPVAFQDREQLAVMIIGAKDMALTRLGRKEHEAKASATQHVALALENITLTEVDNNRRHIADIKSWCTAANSKLMALLEAGTDSVPESR